MAYTALYEGEERGAYEIPFQTDATCLECGGRMRVWREAQDGTARHLNHVANMGGGEGGGTDCSGGESNQHQKWKNFAAERLEEVFDNAAEVAVEKQLAAPHTNKQHRDADAAVMFNQRDPQLGSGLAVEVQHKNFDKDIEATRKDYLKQDVSIAWVYEDDFSEDGCRLNETDFRDRAREDVSLLEFKGASAVPWQLHVNTHVQPVLERVRSRSETLNMEDCDHELEPRTFEVPARLPDEFWDDEAMKIWRGQDWSDLFPHTARSSEFRLGETYESEVRPSDWSHEQPVRLPMPLKNEHRARVKWWVNVGNFIHDTDWQTATRLDRTTVECNLCRKKASVRYDKYSSHRHIFRCHEHLTHQRDTAHTESQRHTVICPHCDTHLQTDSAARGEVKRGKCCPACTDWFKIELDTMTAVKIN